MYNLLHDFSFKNVFHVIYREITMKFTPIRTTSLGAWVQEPDRHDDKGTLRTRPVNWEDQELKGSFFSLSFRLVKTKTK